jgi:hypothetical protein
MENHNHQHEHQVTTNEPSEEMSHIHDNKMMRMTFSSLLEYRVTLLIDSWEIVSPFQYLIAWIVVVLLVVLHHFLRYSLLQIELERQDAPKSLSSSSLSSTSLLSYCFLTSANYGVRCVICSYFFRLHVYFVFF